MFRTEPERTFGLKWPLTLKSRSLMCDESETHEQITNYRLGVQGHQGGTFKQAGMKVTEVNVMFFTGVFYLFLGVAVAADGPQVPDRPPQQDDEEATEERDHG